MDDIEERLRACDCSVHCKSGCIQEKAADEIAKLRAELRIAGETFAEVCDENELLRSALTEMRNRDDRNGSLPAAYREMLDAALTGKP